MCFLSSSIWASVSYFSLAMRCSSVSATGSSFFSSSPFLPPLAGAAFFSLAFFSSSSFLFLSSSSASLLLSSSSLLSRSYSSASLRFLSSSSSCSCFFVFLTAPALSFAAFLGSFFAYTLTSSLGGSSGLGGSNFSSFFCSACSFFLKPAISLLKNSSRFFMYLPISL